MMIIVNKTTRYVNECISYELVNDPEVGLIKVFVESGSYFIDMAGEYEFYDVSTPDPDKQWSYINNSFVEIPPPPRRPIP